MFVVNVYMLNIRRMVKHFKNTSHAVQIKYHLCNKSGRVEGTFKLTTFTQKRKFASWVEYLCGPSFFLHLITPLIRITDIHVFALTAQGNIARVNNDVS